MWRYYVLVRGFLVKWDNKNSLLATFWVDTRIINIVNVNNGSRNKLPIEKTYSFFLLYQVDKLS